MIALNKTIRLFLDSIGRRDEYEFYLNKFQSGPTACFALLCPDAGSIEAGAEVLAFDLHFLLRLELVPAILLAGDDAMAMQQTLKKEPIFIFQTLEKGTTASFIEHARAKERVPVLVAPTVSLEEALLQLLPDTARRVHFIRAAGGLKNTAGELVPYVYTHRENFQILEALAFDYPALGKKLLQEYPGVHLSITSPINLLEEIFTVKGAGTLIRKGSQIDHLPGLEGVDRARLLNLLETAFGKKLAGTAFLDNVAHAYIEQDYRGAVLLEEHPAGLYLSKFAVGKEARGEGLALELWREVHENHGALFWRSNVNNPFNSWYHKESNGHHHAGKWQIYWRGVDPSDISGIIAYCSARSEDFC
ncbi:hypothetical protein EGM51_13620 [Verrucomicrobia bacterium S94]|nr:hypothetical protein EGM51_13620 [Verrucomicrobia bacterium S94]